MLLNIGLQLSFLGTIGMLIVYKTIEKIFAKKQSQEKHKIYGEIKKRITISLSVQIAILPISFYHFNQLGIYFLVANLLVSIIIGPIIILGFFSIFFPIFVLPVEIGLELLNGIANLSQLPFSKIYVTTPSIKTICFYYIGLVVISKIYGVYHTPNPNQTDKRIKNLIALFFYRFREKKKRYLRYILLFLSVIIIGVASIPKDLKLHFVDVGQGDCSFIVTPQNKTILIDGGGSLRSDFDVGEKTVIPYLLDRGYTSIDYVMISHADQDHIGRSA